jgi:hypothetical protein
METAEKWLGSDNKMNDTVLSFETEGKSVKLLMITFARSSTVLDDVGPAI